MTDTKNPFDLESLFEDADENLIKLFDKLNEISEKYGHAAAITYFKNSLIEIMNDNSKPESVRLRAENTLVIFNELLIEDPQTNTNILN